MYVPQVPERAWPLIEVMPVNNFYFAPGCNAFLEAMQFQVYM